MTWTVSFRSLDVADVREFLADHRVAFRETRSCGTTEITVLSREREVRDLAHALHFLGMRRLLNGEDSSLITVHPEGLWT